MDCFKIFFFDKLKTFFFLCFFFFFFCFFGVQSVVCALGKMLGRLFVLLFVLVGCLEGSQNVSFFSLSLFPFSFSLFPFSYNPLRSSLNTQLAFDLMVLSFGPKEVRNE